VVNNCKYTKVVVINIHFAACRITGFVCCLFVTTNKISETGSVSGLRWEDMVSSIAASATGRGKS